jgi:hypothetical protein
MPQLGDTGSKVLVLQRALRLRGYPCGEADGSYGRKTLAAVKAFQAQNLDPRGIPLVVDGVAGPLTVWALTHGKGTVPPVPVIAYDTEPDAKYGGGEAGRAALRAAIGELKAGAGEEGGDNKEPWVKKYLGGHAHEGSNWCAAFVSWCFAQTPPIPFTYTVSARDMLNQLRKKGRAHLPGEGYTPNPGDIVVWWRVALSGWNGHAGIVHHAADGILYTIEGNKSDKVAGFDYVLCRMDKLLGFGEVE